MATVKPLAKMTPAERAKRIAALSANPATRSAIPDKYLPAQYRQQRDMNARLNAPVVQGSQMTNRDLSRSANSATQVKYGDAERQATTAIGQSEQAGRDQAGWYDDYLKHLSQHQVNIGQIGKDATGAVQSLAGASAAPDTAGMSTENVSDSGNAAAVRKAILGAIGATTAAQAGNATSYADTLANVVGPGQKLSAQAQARGNTNKARDNLASLVKEKGAYRDQVISQGVTDEQKNVLAQQALGLDVTKAATQEKQTAAQQAETARHNKASETNAANDPSKKKTQAELDFFAKHHYWPPTGPPKPAKGANGKGPDWLTPNQASGQRSDFDRAKTYAKQLLADPKVSRAQAAAQLQSTAKAQTLYDTKTGKKKLNADGTPATTGSWTKVSSAVASAALDAATSGHLSAYTVKKLIEAGIKPTSLGIPTAGQVKKKPAPKYKGPDVSPGDRGTN